MATLSKEMNKEFLPTLYHECDYLSMLELKLNHVSKKGPLTYYRKLR